MLTSVDADQILTSVAVGPGRQHVQHPAVHLADAAAPAVGAAGVRQTHCRHADQELQTCRLQRQGLPALPQRLVPGRWRLAICHRSGFLMSNIAVYRFYRCTC